MAQRASDIARAVNTLLDFSGDDQTALVEVIQDYFCEPDSEIEDDCGDSISHEGGGKEL